MGLLSDVELEGGAADAEAFSDVDGSGDVLDGLTGPGLRSTLCFREVAFGAGGGTSFETELVGGEGVLDTNREPQGYAARAPDTRHDTPSGARAERWTCRGRKRTAATVRWFLVTVRLRYRRGIEGVRVCR